MFVSCSNLKADFVCVNFSGGAEEVHPLLNYFSFEIYFCKKSVLLTVSKSLNSKAALEPWRFDAFLELFSNSR